MRRVDPEVGSAMMLVPAAVLILVVLGALVVDNASVWMGQRELGSAAGIAATDAVSAVSDSAFYGSGQVVLDPVGAVNAALRSVSDQDLSGVELTAPPLVQVDGRQVCVTLTGVVQPLFGRSIPGFGGVRATVAGDVGQTVPTRAFC